MKDLLEANNELLAHVLLKLQERPKRVPSWPILASVAGTWLIIGAAMVLMIWAASR
jgi:hypothetical protein